MRRSFAVLSAGVALLAGGLAACGDDDDSESATTEAPATTEASGETTGAPDDTAAGGELLRVALLVPSQANDGSFNEKALEGVEQLAEDGLIEFELRENMADPATSEPVIRDYAQQGYDLIIGHGIEISEPVFRVATEFPDVKFTASGGMDVLEKATDNVETWTYDTTQLGFLDGYLAGLTGVTPIGLVEASDFPFIVATDDGFKAGVAETNPEAEILPVVYTGSFDDVQAASEATKGLIDQGAKLIFTGGDGIGIGVASAAAEAGVATVGVGVSAGDFVEEVNIATVELYMYPIFEQWVERVNSGEFGNEGVVSTIENGALVLSPVNTNAPSVPADAQATIDELVAGIQDGSVALPALGS